MTSKTSIISENAILGENVVVGKYSIIEDNVFIAADTTIGDYSKVFSGTTIGKGNRIGDNCFIGTIPNVKGFERNVVSQVKIGNNNTILDSVIICRSKDEAGCTIIGNDNHLGHGCYIGHDVKIGAGNVISAYAKISGYTEIDSFAHIGMAGFIHQFSQIGSYSMIGAMAKIVRDVPPYFLADGNPAELKKVNKVGLARNNFGIDAIEDIEAIYDWLSHSSYPELPIQAPPFLKTSETARAYFEEVIHFIEKSKRGCSRIDHGK